MLLLNKVTERGMLSLNRSVEGCLLLLNALKGSMQTSIIRGERQLGSTKSPWVKRGRKWCGLCQHFIIQQKVKVDSIQESGSISIRKRHEMVHRINPTNTPSLHLTKVQENGSINIRARHETVPRINPTNTHSLHLTKLYLFKSS